VFDLFRLALRATHSRTALTAENLFLRKQRALFQAREPDTLRWQRKGFRLLWRWRSKPTGPPRLPKLFRQLIREIAT
jgi:hypothetical protein